VNVIVNLGSWWLSKSVSVMIFFSSSMKYQGNYEKYEDKYARTTEINNVYRYAMIYNIRHNYAGDMRGI